MVERFPIIQNGVKFLAVATKLTILQSIHNTSDHLDIYTTTNDIDYKQIFSWTNMSVNVFKRSQVHFYLDRSARRVMPNTLI